MIPRNDTRNVETNLLGETQTFSIKASGKAFQVLISGLYSDKVQSIIRELWTNAYDAHVAAGIPDVPFECQLPGPLSPTFRVRDFGVSMDHDMIMSRYSTLFDSTKDGTNEQVGYLGLGSKSPFSYTDSFTIKAFLDGRARTYAAVLNRDGIPSISLLTDTPSDERQGLEVSFAADRNDTHKFREAVRRVLIGFDTAPVGVTDTPPKPIHEGPGWKLFSRNDWPFTSNLAIRQGCVVYPYTAQAQLPHDVRLVADVPIGTVDVTASREQLALTPDTTKAVNDLVASTLEKVYKRLGAEIDKVDHPVHAARLWLERYSYIPNPTWRGKPLSRNVKLATPVDKVPPFGRYDAPTQSEFRVETAPSVMLLVDDGSKVLRKRMRMAAAKRMRNRAVWLVCGPERVQEIKDALGLEDRQILKVQDLPDPGPSQSTPRKRALPAGDFLWGIRVRETYSFPDLGYDETRSNVAGLVRTTLRDRYKVTDDVLWVTERQSKALGLDRARRIDTVLLEHLKADKVKLKAQADLNGQNETAAALIARMPYDVDHSVKQLVVAEILGIDPVLLQRTPVIVPPDVMSLADVAGVGYSSVSDDKLVGAKVSELRAKYPLLFQGRSALYEFYINSVKSEEGPNA